jgi:hemolysin activation/secretion protein
LFIAFASPVVNAAEPVVPGAGSILRQVQPSMPRAPSSPGTELTIEQQDGGKLPPGTSFPVKRLEITGNTLFDTPTLHALVADTEGTSLTLAQLNERVARITEYYRRHGYPLARAILPAQAIQSGLVHIEVLEARFGKLNVENASRVDDRLLQATISPLQGGSAIGQATLDHVLLLLSDIPGVAVNATLKPGEDLGTADLLVNIVPGPAIEGVGSMDNYGNRYTGEAHAGATVNFNNPLRHGDVLSMSVLSSGAGLNYGSLAYDSLLNGQATRVGVAYSGLRYELGGSLDSLDAHGTAQVGSAWVMQPVVRRRNVNLYAAIQYDLLELRDRIDTGAIKTDRHLENGAVSLTGDVRDVLLAGAVSVWNVSWMWGRVAFDDGAAQSLDSLTTRTQGRFSKWNASLSRLQGLTPRNSLYLAISGQWTKHNLDASQKMIAGGPFTVRGYDVGAVAADSGYLGTVELRHDLVFTWASQVQYQLVAFVDSAQVTLNETVWVAGANSATLSGAGLGINLAGSNQWRARFYVATRLGSTPALLASDASTRAWGEISKGF